MIGCEEEGIIWGGKKIGEKLRKEIGKRFFDIGNVIEKWEGYRMGKERLE